MRTRRCRPGIFRWLFALLCTMGVAHAASLQVAPTSVTIDPARGAAGLTLSNTGQDVVHAQVRVFRWSQEDSQDLLAPSDSLVVSPPMLQLAPGARQLIRIVHTGSPPMSGHETTYRVIVDELPVTETHDADKGLRFALRYSIPVFVSAGMAGSPRLGTRILHVDGQTVVEIRNAGTTRAQLADLTLVETDGTRHGIAPGLSGYVLAGQQRRWPLPADVGSTGATFEALLNGEPRARALAPDR